MLVGVKTNNEGAKRAINPTKSTQTHQLTYLFNQSSLLLPPQREVDEKRRERREKKEKESELKNEFGLLFGLVSFGRSHEALLRS